MFLKTLSTAALLCTLVGLVAAAKSQTGTATAEQFIKMRCNTEKATDTILAWSGTSYSIEEQKPQNELFGLYGINLARCWYDKAADSWMFTSRDFITDLIPISLFTNSKIQGLGKPTM